MTTQSPLKWPWRHSSVGFKRDPGSTHGNPDIVWVYYLRKDGVYKVYFDPADGSSPTGLEEPFLTPEDAMAEADRRWPVPH
jgi:hypothetical protein